MFTLDVKLGRLSPKVLLVTCGLQLALMLVSWIQISGGPLPWSRAKQPIPWFLVGSLQPCLQVTSVWVGLPQSLHTLVGSVLCFYPHVVFEGSGCPLGESGEESTFVPLNRMDCLLVGSSFLTFLDEIHSGVFSPRC